MTETEEKLSLRLQKAEKTVALCLVLIERLASGVLDAAEGDAPDKRLRDLALGVEHLDGVPGCALWHRERGEKGHRDRCLVCKPLLEAADVRLEMDDPARTDVHEAYGQKV